MKCRGTRGPLIVGGSVEYTEVHGDNLNHFRTHCGYTTLGAHFLSPHKAGATIGNVRLESVTVTMCGAWRLVIDAYVPSGV